MEAARPRPGERALDLYAGVGLFAAALADAVGPTGPGARRRVRPRRRRARPAQPRRPAQVAVLTARVDDAFGVARPSRRGSAKQRGSRPRKASRSALMPTAADLVVLDPPRTGAGRGVVRARSRRCVRAWSSTSRATRPRWRATPPTSADLGYRLDGLRAFDAFPMTHHVECVARFVPA